MKTLSTRRLVRTQKAVLVAAVMAASAGVVQAGSVILPTVSAGSSAIATPVFLNPFTQLPVAGTGSSQVAAAAVIVPAIAPDTTSIVLLPVVPGNQAPSGSVTPITPFGSGSSGFSSPPPPPPGN